jgi:hypothetical protein
MQLLSRCFYYTIHALNILLLVLPAFLCARYHHRQCYYTYILYIDTNVNCNESTQGNTTDEKRKTAEQYRSLISISISLCFSSSSSRVSLTSPSAHQPGGVNHHSPSIQTAKQLLNHPYLVPRISASIQTPQPETKTRTQIPTTTTSFLRRRPCNHTNDITTIIRNMTDASKHACRDVSVRPSMNGWRFTSQTPRTYGSHRYR